MKTDLIILGGGISGIATAKKAEENSINYMLLEKAPKLGGLTRSMYIGDYIFDYTGHFLHLSKYKSPAEISNAFNNDDWININRNAKCYYKGNLIDAPFQYNLKQLPERLYSKFLHSFLDAEKKQIKSKTFADYLINSFGSEIANNFLIPYNEKLLSTQLNRISKDAVTRFFPPPIKTMIENTGKIRKNTYNATFWYPKADGIQLLVDSLSDTLNKKSILKNNEVCCIDLKNKTLLTNQHKISFKEIVSSLPINTFIKVCPQLNSFQNSLQKDISAGTVLSFHIGLRGRLPKEFEGIHWIYFSEEKYPFYRIGFYNHFNNFMAPKNTYSMYVEVGVKDININVKNVMKSVFNSLEKLRLLKRTNIDLLIYNFMIDGYVHYTHNRESLLTKIKNILEEYNVKLIGRYGKWQYSSMEDSIIEGYEAITEE